ncbi:MAG: 5'/3'-nucleotidase SurE, partial [Actinobacteria bacterium]|nr:5'/3'-nucleotidase SurE [Actinomycetota bacterium]
MAGRDCALVAFDSLPPLIVLTNDDGVSSPGLAALKAALDPLGDVEVIAPDQNRSGAARSITMSTPLSVEEVDLPDGSRAFSTDGTPVDCVRMAALGLLDRRPDLIVSGINLGENLGDDITYSGTVAAALEGIMLDIPAIALSAEGYHAGYDLDVPARFARRLVSFALTQGFPAKTLLNVNVPDRPWEALAGARLTVLGRRIYGDKVEYREARGNRRVYHIYNDDLSW